MENFKRDQARFYLVETAMNLTVRFEKRLCEIVNSSSKPRKS